MEMRQHRVTHMGEAMEQETMEADLKLPTGLQPDESGENFLVD